MQDGYLFITGTYVSFPLSIQMYIDVYAEFCNGSFVVHKTKRLFSSIALDHAYEQVNAVVEGEGGAVGLTENPA